MFIHTCLNDAIENPIYLKDVKKIDDPIYENVEKCKNIM